MFKNIKHNTKLMQEYIDSEEIKNKNKIHLNNKHMHLV